MEQLIEQIKVNNQEACDELVSRTYKYTCFIIREKGITDEETIKDLAQESYMKAFSAIQSLDSGENFFKWFNRIVANCALSYHESKLGKISKITQTFSSLDTYSYDVKFEDTILEKRDEYYPDKKLESSEIKKGLFEAIHELPDHQKEAIIAFYYNQLSIKEIADQYNVSENTVKSWLKYGRDKIKKKLMELDDINENFV